MNPRDWDRFWSKVNKTDTCWLWTDAPNVKTGYGYFRLDAKWQLVHRVAYTELVGPIPEGLTIDHVWPRCTSKVCVRPDHMEPVTLGDNVRRYYLRSNTCAKGHPFAPDQEFGKRHCRVCQAASHQRRRAARQLVSA